MNQHMLKLYGALILFCLTISQNESFGTSYCSATYSSGCNTGYEITSVRIHDNLINNSAGNCAPNGYSDYTSQVANVSLGSAFGISATCGSAGGYLVAWIDFNDDGVFNEWSSWLGGSPLSANQTISVNVPASVNNVLGAHRVRIRIDYGNINPCGDFAEGETEDYTINVIAPTPMSYVSSIVTQGNTTQLHKNANYQEILGVQINVSGISSAFTPVFHFNTNGSTAASVDISKARLYYTEGVNQFSNVTEVGYFDNPNGSFTITSSVPLDVSGKNYFWLAYDVPGSAINGHVLDGECVSIDLDVNRIPSVTAPAGNRQINTSYCSATYSSGCSTGYEITSVQIHDNLTNNTAGNCAPNGYSDYTSQVANVSLGSAFNISATCGSAGGYIAAWIDFNDDGIFNEWSSWQGGSPLSANQTMSVSVPSWANYVLGTHRVRIRIDYGNINPCGDFTEGETEDYTINVISTDTMEYVSSDCIQQNMDFIQRGSSDNEILSVMVTVSGTQSPISPVFTFNTNGCSNPSDITSARLFYTHASNVFSVSNMVGYVNNPNGQFQIPSSQALDVSGTNYFWLAYDISQTAGSGDSIDAECTAIMVDSIRVPATVSPVGFRKVPDCSFTISATKQDVSFTGFNDGSIEMHVLDTTDVCTNQWNVFLYDSAGNAISIGSCGGWYWPWVCGDSLTTGGLTAGTYKIVGSNSCLCTDTVNITIGEPANSICTFELSATASNSNYGINGSIEIQVIDTSNICGGAWNLEMYDSAGSAVNFSYCNCSYYSHYWPNPVNAGGLTPGLYTIIGSNQCGCKDTIVVQVNDTMLSPDLYVHDVSANYAAISAGQTVSLQWQITNQGTVNLPYDWTEYIYVQRPDGQNRTLVAIQNVNDVLQLQAGQSITRTASVTMPSPLAIGDSGIFVIYISSGSSVNELPIHLANNETSQLVPFSVTKQLIIGLSNSTLNEGSSTIVNGYITRNGSLDDSLVVALYANMPGHLIYPSTVIFPPGIAMVSVDITSQNNIVHQGDLSIDVTVSASGYLNGTTSLLLIDDDLGSLTFPNLPSIALEGDTVQFLVKINSISQSPVTVYLTSSNNSRFTVPSSVCILPGNLNALVSVPLVEDNIPELTETIYIHAAAVGYNAILDSITIKDNDIPEIELVINADTISEGAGAYAVQATVFRTSVNSIPFTINLSVSPANTVILPSTISLSANETQKSFWIGVVNNSLMDGYRIAHISGSILISSCGCSGTSATAGYMEDSLIIADDDGPSLTVSSASLTYQEGNATANFIRVRRNSGFNTNLQINLSSSDITELTLPSTAIINAGDTFVDVPITIINDGITDGSQQVYINASSAGFSPGIMWVLVTDVNLPDLIISSVSPASNSVSANSIFNYSVSVNNSGFDICPAGVIVNGFLSADSILDSGDILFTHDSLGVSIAVNQITNISNVTAAPALPGQYYLFFTVNSNSAVSELLYTNNASVSIPLTVTTAYNAIASAQDSLVFQGDSVLITGSAHFMNLSPAAGVAVEVYTVTDGLRRIKIVNTDSLGNFSTYFVPLPNESGHYFLGACFPGAGSTSGQDAFDIPGIRINGGNSPQFLVTLGDTLIDTLLIENIGGIDLYNLNFQPQTLPTGAIMYFDTIAHLSADSATTVRVYITGNVVSLGTQYFNGSVGVNSTLGSIQSQDVWYYCRSASGKLITDISNLTVNVSTVSNERIVQVSLINIGGAATGAINVSLPQVNWIQSMTPISLPELQPFDTALLVFKFLADPSLPFNYPINGTIALNGQNSIGTILPFTYQKVSTSQGSVTVNAVNQYTYYSPGSPKVPNAHVIIKDYYNTNAIYLDGYTDSTGVLTATTIPEGTHRIRVEKDNHLPYNGIVTVMAGGNVVVNAFLDFQAITYSWTVVPTAVQDHYTVTLTADFETYVPKPVVILDIPDTVPQLTGLQTFAFNITATNHGLITAKDFEITLPEDPEYEFITNYVPADLGALQSIQIPVIMRRRDAYNSPLVQTFSVDSALSALNIQTFGETATQVFGCFGVIIWMAHYDCWIVPDAHVQGAATFNVYQRLCNGDFPGGPGLINNGASTHSSNNHNLPGGSVTIDSTTQQGNAGPFPFGYFAPGDCHNPADDNLLMNIDSTPNTNVVCATVSVQFSQQIAMTREAFLGTLQINNGHPTDSLKQLSINLIITDTNGVPSNGLFQIDTTLLNGLSDIQGSGVIPAQLTRGVQFKFIPEQGAAPVHPTIYRFGGTITYWSPFADTFVTVPLMPIPITVNPSPLLRIHYFLERNIISDDPLTTAVEPSIPAELGVLIDNWGYGPAVNLSISSALPEVVDNDKGLAINFTLLGTSLNGSPVSLGLTNIDFGTILPLDAEVGQWYFTSSVLGKFIDYDCNVVHDDSYGNPELSLIDTVTLHELAHSIQVYTQADGINDFLVNDLFDVNDIPDAIYLSQGKISMPVYNSTSANFSSPVNAPTFTNILTVNPSHTGWNYVITNDPGDGLYDILSVTRSDNQVIPLSNAWLTFVTIPKHQSPIYENKFHFVDTFPSLSPVTYTIVWSPRNLDVLAVDTILDVPANVTALQVGNVRVKFTKPVDASTFTYNDMSLVFQGGPNIMSSAVIITQIDSVTFNINLSALTVGNGTYQFTVQAAGISDAYGINGANGKQIIWTQYITVPAVQVFQGIPSDSIASTFSTIAVLFNLPIDLTSISSASFSIYRNNVLQPGNLSIDSVGQNNRLFYLSGLQNIITTDTVYKLVVDLPTIRSSGQVYGMQQQFINLTRDNTGPLVIVMDTSVVGGLDAQHVTSIDFQFNENVYGFNTAALDLRRDGNSIQLNIAQLSLINRKNWVLGNFGFDTYPDGVYTLSINKNLLSDSKGNHGQGQQSISWVVNRTSSIQVSNVSISPDNGYSPSDGITSTRNLNVNFDISSNANQLIISQINFGFESIIYSGLNYTAGTHTIPVQLTSGGNMSLKVHAIAPDGQEDFEIIPVSIDEIPLTGQWLTANNQVFVSQFATAEFLFSDSLLSDTALLSAVQLLRNGVPISTAALTKSISGLHEYTIGGLNAAITQPGNYELRIPLSSLYKHLSGKNGVGEVTLEWTIPQQNSVPVANAGTNITINNAGTYFLNGSASYDPDFNPITYQWIAPPGIQLNNSSLASPSFQVTSSNAGQAYQVVLIVSDGSLTSSDIVNIVVWPGSNAFIDFDQDGYDAGSAFVFYQGNLPNGYSINSDGTDCNDNDSIEHPGQIWHIDSDNDGYATVTTVTQCTRPPYGFVSSELVHSSIDCNDQNQLIHPDISETCNQVDDNCNGLIDENCMLNLNLRVFIEGYYLGASTMIAVSDPYMNSDICDTIIVELHNSNSPYNLAFADTGTIDTSGNGVFQFPSVVVGNSYYITVRHRNSISIWSSAPFIFNSLNPSYSFTDHAYRAFGSNERDLGDGNYAMFSGDLNQDGVVESEDYIIIENAVGAILLGYNTEDVTGDWVVEASDYIIVENGVSLIMHVIRP